MSIDWSARVWQHSRQTGSAKLLLLAIAREADANGSTTNLSIPDLVQAVGARDRAVQALLQKLEQAGELRRDINAGPYGRNRYTILLGDDSHNNGEQRAAPAPLSVTPSLHIDTPTPPVADNGHPESHDTMLKEGKKEAGREHAPAENQTEQPVPTPSDEPALPSDPLSLWQTVRAVVQPLDAHHVHLLVIEQDAPTAGQGSYWVGRAILAAVATDPTFATNPKALNLVRAILSRWQREHSYGSDTKAYQQRSTRTNLC